MILGLDNDGRNFYLLASLIASALEEITPYNMSDFCYTVNSLQFEAVQQLAIDVVKAAQENGADWTFLTEGEFSFEFIENIVSRKI